MDNHVLCTQKVNKRLFIYAGGKIIEVYVVCKGVKL